MDKMESRVGLEYIVENKEYMGKLSAALGNPSIAVKRQVVELLSALCVYSSAGYGRVLDTLALYQSQKGERYRFGFIVAEVDKASQAEYQTALVAFINCLIISAPRLPDRVRVRSEFIGLNLLPILNRLRQGGCSPDLLVQLDVFTEQRENDENRDEAQCVDLSSPLDVFYAVLRRVADTQHESTFLGVLQHLLRAAGISSQPTATLVWNATDTLVHRATLIENEEDAARLLRTPTSQAKLCCNHCSLRSECTSPVPEKSPRKSSAGRALSPSAGRALSPSPAPPPPPVPAPPPPAPPSAPPPPPPGMTPLASSTPKPPAPLALEETAPLLPQQETPVPKSKMKTVNWNKIPNNKVIGKNNIWSLVASKHKGPTASQLDWEEMEGLFCQQIPPGSASSSPRLGRAAAVQDNSHRPRTMPAEITLLDGKRSLNVNIFLKQFKSPNAEIIEMIRTGAEGVVGAERLRGLLRLLPEMDELDVLKAFTGDSTKLGNAEKFLMQLIQLPNYKLRIEAMLLKEEFGASTNYLESSINAILVAGDDLTSSQALQDILYIALIAGNFLNAGGYAGCAAGIKLSSLQKLTDIRANKPGMNLMHYVAIQAEKKSKDLAHFADDLRLLEDASKTTVEQLTNEINTLNVRINKIKSQVDLPATDGDIKKQNTEFLNMAGKEMIALKKDMEEVEAMKKSLAEFFCEDPASFKLEECFKIILGFCLRFKQAANENARRKLQEQQAAARRAHREDQLRKRQGSNAGTPCSDSETGLVDSILLDIRSGFTQGRRPSKRYDNESLNIPVDASPDITPTGSLRRRRGRPGSSEDEGGLMQFLRASSDSQKAAESWGSLDRSFARRGGPIRARLEIPGMNRERPSSPRVVPEPVPPQEDIPKPREWKQKIESWLRSNQQDNQMEDARNRARRLTANRRSLEDSESERSGPLDPLPEGKLAENQPEYLNKPAHREWRPSAVLDKDVVSAMEAIEDIQQQSKPHFRLEETAEDLRRIRRQRSRPNPPPDSPPPLDSIKEEDKIKKINVPDKSVKSDNAFKIEVPWSEKLHEPRSRRLGDSSMPNRIEIDSDNIETPPVTRRTFNPPPENREPCRRFITSNNRFDADPKVNLEEPLLGETLGDGQFDRFSATRRTRRYKRPTDYNSQNEDSKSDDVKPAEIISEKHATRPTKLDLSSTYVDENKPLSLDNLNKLDEKDTRLKKWQERLKRQDSLGNEKDDPITQKPSSSHWMGKVRHQTSINQEDVQKAIRELKSPTDSPRHLSLTKAPAKTAKSATKTTDVLSSKYSKIKGEHELNDEGFEETNSLNSESASQGASSGCNETDAGETKIKQQRIIKIVPNNITVVTTNKSRTNVANNRSLRNTPLIDRNNERRSLGLRKADSQSSVGSLRSRGSLRSSRSSLNSSASVSTVRRAPPAPVRPRIPPAPPKQPIRIAASRSSSSGSSVAQKVIRPTVAASRSSSSGSSSIPPRAPSSFMRPTQSSRTKVHRVPSKPPTIAFK